MRLNNNIFLVILLIIPLLISAQKKIKGFPDDLDKSKIIFLEFEKLPINPGDPGLVKMRYRKYNKIFKRNNEKLAQAVRNYPFAYIISKRSEYRELKKKGYKYVLECDMLKSFNNGTLAYGGGNTKYVSKMYLLDMDSKVRYELFNISESQQVSYGQIIKKFNKKVIKEYKTK